MKKAKILLVGIILILVRVPEVKAMFGDWNFKTKAGTELHNKYEAVVITKKNIHISFCQEWYFFKNNICGFRKKKYEKGQPMVYFVFDENSTELNEFEKIEAWRKFIFQKKLEPKIWTRWHKIHGNDFVATCGVIVLFHTHLAFGILFLLTCLSFLFFKKVFFDEAFNLKKPFTRILIFLIGIGSISYLLSENLQSI